MEDEPDMRFFPGMNLPKSQKLDFLAEFWTLVVKRFDLRPMRDHAAQTAWQNSANGFAGGFGHRRRELVAGAGLEHTRPQLVTEGT
jgi:hypothetical protein